MRQIRPLALILSAGLLASLGAGLVVGDRSAHGHELAAAALPPGPGADALAEATKALRSLKSATFHIKHSTENLGASIGGDAKVRLLRHENGVLSLRVDGWSQAALGGKQERRVGVSGFNASTANQRNVTWVDFAKKTMFTQDAASRSEAAVALRDTEFMLLRPLFTEAEPFAGEQAAKTITEEAPQDVGGVACQVWRVGFGNAGMERLIFIGIDDKLPRRYEQIRASDKPMKLIWEITDLKVDPKLSESDFAIEAPSGFKTERLAPPTPPSAPAAPAAPAPGAQPVLPVNPVGPARNVAPPGPGIGARVPNVTITTLTGAKGTSEAKLDDTLGRVRVVALWNLSVPASAATLATLAQARDEFANQPVTIMALAARTSNVSTSPAEVEQGVRDAWAQQKASPSANFVGGWCADDLVAALSVRGFPSVAVIDAQGKSVAFLEGAPTLADIKGAVARALAQK